MKTHDYRGPHRTWGHDYAVLKVDGLILSISGWGKGIEKGDFILLQSKDVKGETRYQIIEIEYRWDPPDMWFATATFAPRAEGE